MVGFALSFSIATAFLKVTPDKSAPAWKPALDDETGKPFALTVPAGLNLAD